MKVTPYGDPNAHGTIGKCLTFIRRRGFVFCRPYKVPTDPRTPAQLAQRQFFKDGKTAWDALSSESRDYYNLVAQGTPQTGYNLFLSHYLNNDLPSTTPFTIADISNAVIGDLRATVFNGWKIDCSPVPSGTSFGYVWDNENIWHNGAVHPTSPPLRLDISKIAQNIDIHFKDRFTIDWTPSGQLTIYLPVVTSNISLYVSDDGSTYLDSGLTKLVASPIV